MKQSVKSLKKKAVWMDVKNTNGFYRVSSHGEVVSFRGTGSHPKMLEKPKKLKPYFNKSRGYKYVAIELPARKNWAVHRLVAEHFIEKPDGKDHVNHIDCDKLNNRADNLEWVTPLENVRHAISMGRVPVYNWTTAKSAKLTPAMAQEIKSLKGKKRYIDIADLYGVKYSTIAHIMTNRRWKCTE